MEAVRFAQIPRNLYVPWDIVRCAKKESPDAALWDPASPALPIEALC